MAVTSPMLVDGIMENYNVPQSDVLKPERIMKLETRGKT